MLVDEREFIQKFAELQRSLSPAFAWYPYPSLGNVQQWEELLGPKRTVLDLARGSSVLDIGCADGAVAFFLEQQGCDVRAIDFPSTNYNGMQGVRLLRTALHSHVEIQEADLDSQFTLVGRYSLALFLGILYHLKNPFYALETLARHARFCLLSTRVAAITPSGQRIQHEPVAYLLDHDEANQDSTNFWIFSEVGLRRILHRSGWEIKSIHTRGCLEGSNPKDSDRDERAYCFLESRFCQPDVELLQGWHEKEISWCWTERCFSVRVARPVSTSENQMAFQFRHIHDFPVTLTVTVDGHPLASQQFATKGEHIYRALIQSAVLEPPVLRFDFELDRAYTATTGDLRELGILVDFFRAGYPDSVRNLPLRFS